MKQQSFTEIEYENRKRRTKRDEFLERMDRLIPWKEWRALAEPYYPSGRRGRPPRGVEVMLRMYLLSVWFNLSDEGVEDAIYDSYAFRQFLGIDFWAHEQAPDATTLCKFRKMLTEQGVMEQLFESIKALPEENGQIMHGGSIVDATIIEAPSSTKNAENRRDPEMHQVKKGNEWHLGERIHIGADAGTGYVHSLEVTAANVPERDVVPRLVRPDDETVSGDGGYTGMEKREEIKNDPHLQSPRIYPVHLRQSVHAGAVRVLRGRLMRPKWRCCANWGRAGVPLCTFYSVWLHFFVLWGFVQRLPRGRRGIFHLSFAFCLPRISRSFSGRGRPARAAFSTMEIASLMI